MVRRDKYNPFVARLFEQIRDELDPNEFSHREVVDEFGDATDLGPGRAVTDSYISRCLNRLIERGWIERLEDREGWYRVTDRGMYDF